MLCWVVLIVIFCLFHYITVNTFTFRVKQPQLDKLGEVHTTSMGYVE